MKIDANLCPANHPCPALRICPVGAISQKANGLPVIDEASCLDCMACVKFCPMGAIRREA